MLKGGCLCGGVLFEVASDPIWSAVCHCESCRRATSSPVTAFVGVKKNDVKWFGDKPSTFHSSEKADRLFCPTCGSQLAYVSKTRTEQMDLYTASLENPDAFPPTKSAFSEEALSFTRHIPDLPDWT